MSQEREQERSQLFTVRVWLEDVEDGRTEIRGTVKHVLSGEIRHFPNWPSLIQHIEAACKQEKRIEQSI